jgi:hypothetical protein
VSAKRDGATGSFSTRTDADGNYTLRDDSPYSGLITGSYRLYADLGVPYLRALYGGTSCAACDGTGATPVQVNAPATATGIDLRMIKVRVTSVSPAVGPSAGGTRVVITGANFQPQSKVRIGGQDAVVLQVTPTEIVALTPAASEGPAHVTVDAAGLSVTLTHAFDYRTTRRQRAARSGG